MPLRPICPADFAERPRLTEDFLRPIEAWLSDQVFAEKIAILWPQGAWAAMRGHPAGFWADLAQLDPGALPGGEGVCLGDAHFDNFGLILLPGDEAYIFAPNDLDDGGVGRVALDALKYFAVLAGHPRLRRHVEALVELYVKALRDPSDEERLPKRLLPKPSVVRKKKLLKYTEGAAIKVDALPFQPAPLGEDERGLLRTAVEATPQLRGSALLDAVDQFKLSGGSYGGQRYWALIDRAEGGGLDLLELKAMTTPATSLGKGSVPVSQHDRIGFLKDAMWGSTSNEDYFVTALGGREFLVRSRLRKASLAPLELDDPDDVDDVLEAQVSVMARLHRPAMEGIKRERLRVWLRESADVILDRWNELLESAAEAPPP